MPLSQSEARDETLTIVRNAFESIASGFVVIYDNSKATKPRDGTTEWARVSMKHVARRQAALVSPSGQRRYTNTGLLTIEIFLELGKGSTRVDAVSPIIRGSLEGTDSPNGVWYRNVTVNEQGKDGNHYKVNVLADFEYDEVS